MPHVKEDVIAIDTYIAIYVAARVHNIIGEESVLLCNSL